jgi:hypothetical protein
MLVGVLVTMMVASTSTAMAAFASSTPAGDATATPAGRGTTKVTGQLLDLSVGGELLHLSAFTDSGIGNIDPANGPLTAKNTLVPLSLSSSVLPVSTLTALLPGLAPLTAQTPAGVPSVDLSTLDLSATPLGVLLGGTLNAAKLSTALSPLTGAVSRLTASLSHLNVLGGLVSIDALTDQDVLQATPAAATASRTVDVGHIGLLNLGALLHGLGIDPASLPLNTVVNLLSQLNLPGLPTGQLLSGLLSTVTGLTKAVEALLNTPLLEVDTGPLSVLTKATSSVTQSSALVSSQLPAVKVAGQNLGGDLTSLLSSVQTLLGSLLGTITPSLASLVTVSLLPASHSVTQSHGYTDAVAQASELTISIDPAKVLGGLSAAATAMSTASDSPAIGSMIGDNASVFANPFASSEAAGLGGAPLGVGPTTLTLGAVTSESRYSAKG